MVGAEAQLVKLRAEEAQGAVHQGGSPVNVSAEWKRVRGMVADDRCQRAEGKRHYCPSERVCHSETVADVTRVQAELETLRREGRNEGRGGRRCSKKASQNSLVPIVGFGANTGSKSNGRFSGEHRDGRRFREVLWDALSNQASQQVQSSHRFNQPIVMRHARYGLVRIGDASHPGPNSPVDAITGRFNPLVEEVLPTQWDSEADFSLERGTGFTLTSLVSAMEFDLTRADSEGAECGGAGPRQESTSVDSDSDQCDVLSSTESCTSAAVTNCQRRRWLRLVWSVHHTTQWHRGAPAADELIQNLASRVGSAPPRADATGADNATAVVDW